jgi:hypothetical protein
LSLPVGSLFLLNTSLWSSPHTQSLENHQELTNCIGQLK